MKTFLLIIYLLFSFVAINAVQAKIYKCKDKEGVINFTSVPCGEKSVSIKRSEKKVELNEDGTKKTRKQLKEERAKREKEFLEVSKREREDKEQKRKKLQQHQNKIRKNCERAKKELSGIQNSHFVYRKDKNGKRHIMSDDERKKAADGAQRQVSYWCRN